MSYLKDKAAKNVAAEAPIKEAVNNAGIQHVINALSFGSMATAEAYFANVGMAVMATKTSLRKLSAIGMEYLEKMLYSTTSFNVNWIKVQDIMSENLKKSAIYHGIPLLNVTRIEGGVTYRYDLVLSAKSGPLRLAQTAFGKLSGYFTQLANATPVAIEWVNAQLTHVYPVYTLNHKVEVKGGLTTITPDFGVSKVMTEDGIHAMLSMSDLKLKKITHADKYSAAANVPVFITEDAPNVIDGCGVLITENKNSDKTGAKVVAVGRDMDLLKGLLEYLTPAEASERGYKLHDVKGDYIITNSNMFKTVSGNPHIDGDAMKIFIINEDFSIKTDIKASYNGVLRGMSETLFSHFKDNVIMKPQGATMVDAYQVNNILPAHATNRKLQNEFVVYLGAEAQKTTGWKEGDTLLSIRHPFYGGFVPCQVRFSDEPGIRPTSIVQTMLAGDFDGDITMFARCPITMGVMSGVEYHDVYNFMKLHDINDHHFKACLANWEF